MNPYVFPQGDTFGGRWVGLDATPTGSAASNIVVADFTGSTQRLFPAPSVTIPVIAVHSQTLGSTFKIAMEGFWVAQARVNTRQAASLVMGISIDSIAADLNTDPFLVSDTIMDVDLSIGGQFGSSMVSSMPIAVTRFMAYTPTLAIVRVLMGNSAGGGVNPVGLFLPNSYVRIVRVADLPATTVG